MRSGHVLVLLASATALLSCSRRVPPGDFQKLTQEFVYTSLSFSPVTASGQGLHTSNGQDFDGQLDDESFAAVNKQREFLTSFHRRLEELDKNSLSPEDRADYDIVESQIGLGLFELDIAQGWRHAPQQYVELLGTALFNPLVLEYAPKEKRFRDIISRLRKIPVFLDQAKRALFAAPPVWIQVARQENDGNIDMIDHTLRPAAPAELKADYDSAAAAALDELRAFNLFLDRELPKRTRGGTPDWRLGPQHYETKFKLALATDRSSDQVLADAETRLKQVRARMLELSLPLHAKWFAGHGGHADLKGEDRENKVIREVLDHIAGSHSTEASYFDDAKKDLAQATDFVRAKNLLTLPPTGNLQVIPTPEFERGIYGVGGFDPAPVLEPQLGAFFWITPIPADWPKTRVESKLREYNFFNLQLLVLHEAMPGHYVQFEVASTIEPKTRRVLRGLFGNDPYIEGWAQYATQAMLDAGYLDNAPELRLQLLKQELRVDANAILDIRLQTNRMTDDQAMQLMERDTFQEHEEAVAKLQRAKLSSVQLPTYFVGWRDWLRVRDLARKTEGAKFNLHNFHDQVLREGAVPLPVLARLVTGKDLQ
jgi:uncharacterized protein (DUF885 family)